MIRLIVRFGMPSAHYRLNIWKHQGNTDSVVVKHSGVEVGERSDEVGLAGSDVAVGGGVGFRL